MADKRLWVARTAMRNDWLDQVQEEIIDPDREIVDPHHHLWNRGGSTYEMAELWSDTGSGHNVVETIFIECFAEYRPDGPDHLKPVGETEYVAGLVNAAGPGGARVTGIVAHADLRLPLQQLDEVLDAHKAASGGRFRGIRHAGAHEPNPEALAIPGRGTPGQYQDPDFQRGVAHLGEQGLTYDTWHYHLQNQDFIALAKAAPGTTLILDHLGTPLGVGQYAGQRDQIFAAWKDDMAALAECPNVVAKLGGLAMPDNGYGWHDRDRPPSSDELVEVQGDWYRHMIACFGPDRCMFESNFPVDRLSIGYPVLWNAFKKIGAGYDTAAQNAMFAGTARRVYNL
ncbi:MAG: amidohydrolase family protein [Pseudomonadota bacterium]